VLVEGGTDLVGELAGRLVPAGPDDPEVVGHQPGPEQPVEAGEELAAGEVATCPKQDEQMRIRGRGFRGDDGDPHIRPVRRPNRSAA
jgi:hypothetical protein